jgi:hypothetical protein
MALYQLAKSIAGQVGGTPLDLVLSSMKQALIKIYSQNDWSFQRSIVYANWLVPGNVATNGSTTVTPYSNTVILNGAASAAVNTYTSSPGAALLTQLQYRDPSYSIYNIVAAGINGTVGYVNILTEGFGQIPGVWATAVTDASGPGTGGIVQITVLSNGMVQSPVIVLNPGSGYVNPVINFATSGTPATFQVFQEITLTLDRPWLEPTSGGGQNYMIYQAYFVAPSKYFTKFIEIRDTTDAQPIDFWSMTQAELAIRDPQRTCFSDPDFCVPAGVDNRPGTSTPGWPMFELWPQQLSYEPYSFSYRSLGPVPETQQDFLSFFPPYPISEELIEWRTREVLFQFREAQKDKSAERGSGANWLLLAQMAQKEYAEVLDKIQAIDLNLNGEAFSRTSPPGSGFSGRPFANRIGGLNVGGYGNGDY